MALPLWQLKQLQMNREHKFGLALLFMLGFVIIAFDITRICVSAGGGNESLGALWDVVEPAVAVIVATLPTYRAFFVSSKPLSANRYRNYKSSKYSGNSYPSRRANDSGANESDVELAKPTPANAQFVSESARDPAIWSHGHVTRLEPKPGAIYPPI